MRTYLKTVWYNIIHNWAYTLFLVLGTAMTFVFVTILVHLDAVLEGGYPPMSKAESIISLRYFKTDEGKYVQALSESEQKLLLTQIGDYEAAAVYLGTGNFTGAAINGHYITTNITFVNPDFWNVYDYTFVDGRPFTEEEMTSRRRCVVITKNLSRRHFNTSHSVGKKLEMDRTEYEVVGVVDNISMFAAPASVVDMYFPYIFNNVSWENSYLSVLFGKGIDMQQMKMRMAELTRKIYESKNIRAVVDTKTVLTDKEETQKTPSQLGFVSFGLLIFVFMLIPAMNIVSINMAQTKNREHEIAIRRSYGSSVTESFFRLLSDGLLLSLVGVVLGILLAKPFIDALQSVFFDKIPMLGGASLMPGIDWTLTLTVIMPLMIVFILMFGGIPAWTTSRQNIADTLKGGIK
jgi:ABC-type antimicrobial peptide transport system permease subunit